MNQWMELAGGLGLFLVGIILMTDGLKALAGDALHRALSRFTRSPTSGAFTGAATTAILQSSSATTVAAVGFVGAGLLSYPQALGVIFGANLGTTVTGWMVALLGFKLELNTLLLPCILAGALAQLFGRGRWRAAGLAIAGFGLIFVGIDAMQVGMSGLEGRITPDSFPDNTWLGRLQLLLLGALITLITQSSSAGVATALTAVHSGALEFEQAAAMVIGMDVGTTATALFATLGGSAETRRTGYSHVVYNVFTGIAAFLMLLPYVALWQWWAPGAIYEQAEVALVAFHSLFNLLGVILVLPLAGQFARFMLWLVPEAQEQFTGHLDKQLLKDPAIALEAVRRSLRSLVEAQLQYCIGLLRDQPSAKPERHRELDDAIERCQRYVDDIHLRPDTPDSWQRLLACMHVIDHMQRLHLRLADRETAQRWQKKGPPLHSGVVFEDGCRQLVKRLTGESDDVAGAALAFASRCEDETESAREALMAEIASGNENTVNGDLYLDALRWQRRSSRHFAKIFVYLDQLHKLSPYGSPDSKAE
ncbi:Na/Pi cotransporter family protein [Spongiibacter marinus]|uniref:Na/Pi cotransporter family protein n=1 Tax=Spongiibacter marinus TaxID=354246 RepID=UPI0035616168